MLKKISIFLLIIALIMPMVKIQNSSVTKVKAADNVSAFTRQTINFNREWKFVRDDAAGAQEENYNDSSWYNVGLPHDFSIPYWQEEKHYTGYGWYRKTFDIKNEWAGRHITLDFAGVFHTAEVYINGQFAGMHEGGYTGFEIDITDYVRTGSNVVAIRVNNLWKADLAPRSGDHMFTGGIYRDVNLVITNPVHVAWYGTFVQTPDVSKERANVRVLTEITNDSSSAQTVNVINTVYDSSGNEVAVINSPSVTINAKNTYEFDDTSAYIPNPRLWSPETPNLYSVHTNVMINGTQADQYDTTFGFRWYEFSPDEGFFLNGEHYWIDGANAHQDHAGWANAVTTEALYRDVAMIKESGLNFIRGSHYPHSPAYGDACDKIGMLFWSEAAFWCTSFWGEGSDTGTSDDYKADGYPSTGNRATEEAFEQSCINNLSEMIRINRNHPSIIVWSMGNEPFFGDNAEKKKALISKMAGIAKELDPTRCTAIGGTQRGSFDHLPNVDIAGYNGDGADMPEYQNPGVGNLVSEYSTHTGNRPENFTCYYGSVQTDENGEPIRYPWRSGIALWCAFHHGSILSRSYGDMGYIDYYRLPLNIWYYYRYNRTGVEPESSQNGTPDRLLLDASSTTIKNDGTSDTHITVTVADKDGNWLNSEPEVTFEVTDGPGIFPTGKSITFKPGDSMRDGKAAIEFRSYYAGTTTIKAYSDTNPEIKPATITITTTGEGSVDEPAIETMYGAFMSNGGYVPNSLEEPTPYRYHRFKGCPMNSSSGLSSVVNIQDGDNTTSWTAETPGSGQWLYLEIEHGGMSLYKAKLIFNGKAYPYRIQYKSLNISEDEWITLKEYNSDTINQRPAEDSLGGTYMRYIRIEFPDVPAGEYASLAELKLYGIRADSSGYTQGIKPLSEIPNDAVTIDKDTGVITGKTTDGSECNIVYDLEKDSPGYARFQTNISFPENADVPAPVTFSVYCDDELMYEKTINGPSESCNIDISINKVKNLKITASSSVGGTAFQLKGSRLMGVYRDITRSSMDYGNGNDDSENPLSGEETILTQMCPDMDTLQPGKTLHMQVRITNKNENRISAALAALLYRADHTPVKISLIPVSIPGKGSLASDFAIDIPENIGKLDYVKIIGWNADTLVPFTRSTVISEDGSDTSGTGLNPSGSEANLLTAIQEAMQIIYSADADKYTNESKTGYTEALIYAAGLLLSPETYSQDFDAAALKIRNAIAGLRLTPKGNSGNNTPAPGLNIPKPSSPALSKGILYKAGKYRYKVLKTTKKSANVTLYRPLSKKMKTAVIPATVKIKGIKCKVTAISDKAFANNKQLTKAVIGKNITKIGKKAFYNTKKLKKVTIKSKVIKSVAKNSFKKTGNKLKFKVPAKKAKAYRKFFKNKTLP